MQNRYYKPIKLADSLSGINKNMVNKFGNIYYTIYSKWEEIVGAFFIQYSHPEKITITSQNSNNEIKELLPVLCNELVNSSQNFTDKEIEKSKSQLKASMLMSIESTMNNAMIAAYQLLRYDRLIEIEEKINKIDKVTKNSIEKIAEKLVKSTPTISSIGPISKLENVDQIKKRLN